MNKLADGKLSASSSRESLDGKQQEADACEMDWKKKVNSTASSEDEEIEISEAKSTVVAGEAAAAACTVRARGEQEEEETTPGGISSVRRLKSATLDRMGKMLKLHSKSSGEKPDVTPTLMSNEDASRKQKFNSLTRMLRFTDKEDKSKSLGQYRGHSLTRILRRKVPIESDNPVDKPEEHVPGLFSRLLGQIKGRTTKSNTHSSGSPSQKLKEKKTSLSPKSPSSSGLSDVNLDSSCPVGMSARHQI